MDDFEQAWQTVQGTVRRYVHFRIDSTADAEDVLQEVCMAACRGFTALADKERFRAWVIGIARNKCTDWLRRKYRLRESPLEDADTLAVPARFAAVRDSLVEDTLDRLDEHDRTLLRMCYWQELPQGEIARRLGIPLGTVKSRLHAAKGRFRNAYPVKQRGEPTMHIKMPDSIPDYSIRRVDEPPFPVKWEELMGWFIVPRLGETLTWAMYDDPDGHRTEMDELTVTCRAMVHGIEGVEIEVKTHAPMECNAVDDSGYVQRSMVAQLTDSHCRILSETHTQDGVKRMYTFLDEEFLGNWGFGEDNCGNETNLQPRGDIVREGSAVTTAAKQFLLDVVGRYEVEIGGRKYDTICVMDVETYNDATVSEQYIDRSGRTVLWRRFNRDDWQMGHYGRRWSEMLPDSDRITVNGDTFVHWYDCITSYIL